MAIYVSQPSYSLMCSYVVCYRYIIEQKDLSIANAAWKPLHEGVMDSTRHRFGGYNPERDYLYRIRARNPYGTSDCTMPAAFYGRAGRGYTLGCILIV